MRTVLSLIAVVSLLGPGCTAIGPSLAAVAPKWGDDTDAKPKHVVETLALWQPGEGTGVDGIPCRGFAGQIMFFAAGSEQPVEVDGNLRIYVFDDQGDDPAKPVHIFNFVDGSWAKYRRETKIGVSYHVFVPYTRPGAHQAVCSLRVRFQNEVSHVIGEPGDVLLTGSKSAPDGNADAGDIVQVGHTDRPRRPSADDLSLKHEIINAEYRGIERPPQLPDSRVSKADERLARVEAMLGRLDRSPGSDSTIRQASHETPADPAATDDPPKLKVYTIPIR